MIRRFVLVTLVAALCVPALAPAPAAAGSGWHLVFTHRNEGVPQTVLMDMEGDLMRLQAEGTSQEVVIGDEAFTFIDHAAKTYTVVTIAQVETALGAMTRAMEGMKETQRRALEAAMGDMPEEDRARVQTQLDAIDERGTPGRNLRLETTMEKATIAGLEAQKLVAYEADEPRAEIWVTRAITSRPVRELLERLKDLAPMQQNMDTRHLAALLQLEGFPLRLVDLSESDGGEELVVTEAVRKDFVPGDFRPPYGYEEKSFDMGFGP